MKMITDKKFLIGAAVGFFLVPMASKHIRAAVEKVKGAAG